jgi:hypothetical protein
VVSEGESELADTLVRSHRPAHYNSECVAATPQPPPSRSASSTLALNPSTSNSHANNTQTKLSTNRHNGEFELPHAAAEAGRFASRSTRQSEFATKSSPRTLCGPRVHTLWLYGTSRLTENQVLAVDLLNPTPAAYADTPDSMSTPPD